MVQQQQQRSATLSLSRLILRVFVAVQETRHSRTAPETPPMLPPLFAGGLPPRLQTHQPLSSGLFQMPA
jgi:hypothetical protein